MYICEKDYHCVDCPRIYPEEECDHWVDVEFVVRCKNCYAYRKDLELARAEYLYENMYCALLRTEMPEDGFCYYGRTKDES